MHAVAMPARRSCSHRAGGAAEAWLSSPGQGAGVYSVWRSLRSGIGHLAGPSRECQCRIPRQIARCCSCSRHPVAAVRPPDRGKPSADQACKYQRNHRRCASHLGRLYTSRPSSRNPRQEARFLGWRHTIGSAQHRLPTGPIELDGRQQLGFCANHEASQMGRSAAGGPGIHGSAHRRRRPQNSRPGRRIRADRGPVALVQAEPPPPKGCDDAAISTRAGKGSRRGRVTEQWPAAAATDRDQTPNAASPRRRPPNRQRIHAH